MTRGQIGILIFEFRIDWVLSDIKLLSLAAFQLMVAIVSLSQRLQLLVEDVSLFLNRSVVEAICLKAPPMTGHSLHSCYVLAFPGLRLLQAMAIAGLLLAEHQEACFVIFVSGEIVLTYIAVP